MSTAPGRTSGTGQGASRDGGVMQFCTFWVAGRLYGVEILKVKEITGETSFTPIHHAPDEVRGYVNIRGQINLVIDLRLLLGFEGRAADASSRVVLFKPEVGEHFGVLVDKLGDVVATEAGGIESRSKATPSQQHTADAAGADGIESGVCKLEKSLMVVIDPARILSAVQEKLAC